MDFVIRKEHLLEYIKKYRYFLLVLLAGILLMSLPERDSEAYVSPEPVQTEPDLQESLADILSMVQGAGKVQVLLTQAAGEEIRYQTDDQTTPESIRRETVLTANSEREEQGLVKQVNPPVYQGAIILCQGADNANVRLSIVNAVKSVTGLSADHIAVLKMK